MELLKINPSINHDLNDLVSMIYEKYKFISNDLLNELWMYNRLLPESIWFDLNKFKYSEVNYGVLLIQGYQLNDNEIGSTPDSPNLITEQTIKCEILLLLLSSILGEVISWSSQRDGRIVNDIVPVRGNEYEQLSLGSKALLEWHTEEAFHPYRPDNLALFCLRNPNFTPTTVGSIQDIKLSNKTKSILFEPRFIFDVDKNFVSWSKKGLDATCVLFGDYNRPYVKIDPAFMNVHSKDIEARIALDEIIYQFNLNIKEIILSPGDFCFIDNYRAVHGRKGFIPKYDGKDRWLKRVNIARDLRKSRDSRDTSDSRVIIIK